MTQPRHEPLNHRDLCASVTGYTPDGVGGGDDKPPTDVDGATETDWLRLRAAVRKDRANPVVFDGGDRHRFALHGDPGPTSREVLTELERLLDAGEKFCIRDSRGTERVVGFN